LDNNINEGISNSVSKVIRLIERNIFFTDSLFYFSKRILLTKWSLLYYSSISSFTYTNISTELKDNYLFYFWIAKQLIGFYQLILILEIFLSSSVITPWLILLANILLYSTMNKLQQFLYYSNLEYTKGVIG
jgi:hypothetical protein